MSDQDATPREPASERMGDPLLAFLQTLWQSKLLSPEQEQALLAQAEAVDRQPQTLAAWLVAHGWLTSYQTSLLLAGRAAELILGNYRLLAPLGEGGMGQVFEARQILMNRVVALKIMHPDVVNNPTAVGRFHREIQAAAQLRHPNVVVAHDAEEVGGRHFLVMELCEGPTLGQLVERVGPLPVESACEYVRQAALGLQHAFECGWVHRDVKPQNLILDGETVKILDFGLARLRPAGDVPAGPLTQVGSILGTPDFLAPEQAEGRADGRSDLYSLGCTLYFLLTGCVPFPEGTLLEKCLRHKFDEPEPLAVRRPDVPAAVQEVVRRLMAKAPNDRFQTPAEVAAALAPFARLGPLPPPVYSPPDRTQAESIPSVPDASAPTMDSSVQLQESPPVVKGASRPSRVGRWLMTGMGVALAVVLGCGIAFLVAWFGRDRERPEDRKSQDSKPEPSPRAWRTSRTLPIPEGQIVYGLAFSPDGQLLAGAIGHLEDRIKRPGHVLLWEVVGWDVELKQDVESGPVTCLAFSPDGKTLAWGVGHTGEDSGAGEFTLWDVANKKARVTVGAHDKGVFALAFQPHGNLLATSGREGKILLWDASSGKSRGELHDCKREVMTLAFSPDGKRLAAGCDDGSLHLWEVSTKAQLGPLPDTPPGKPIRGVNFTPDGAMLFAVTKSPDGSGAEVLTWKGRETWKSRDRQRVPAIPLGKDHAYCLAFSPDGTTFLAGCREGTAKLYDTASREELQTLSLSKDRHFYCLAFSPRSRHLATGGGRDYPVQVWEEKK